MISKTGDEEFKNRDVVHLDSEETVSNDFVKETLDLMNTQNNNHRFIYCLIFLAIYVYIECKTCTGNKMVCVHHH